MNNVCAFNNISFIAILLFQSVQNGDKIKKFEIFRVILWYTWHKWILQDQMSTTIIKYFKLYDIFVCCWQINNTSETFLNKPFYTPNKVINSMFHIFTTDNIHNVIVFVFIIWIFCFYRSQYWSILQLLK